MIKHRLWFGIAACTLLSSGALAQGYGYGGGSGYRDSPAYGYGYNGFYLGASAGAAFYNEDGIPQLTPTIAMFRVGQQFNPYLAIEGRIGTSISAGESQGDRVNLDAIYGGYVKGMLPINRWVSPYVIAGIGGAQIHRNYFDFNSNDAGLSFGVGGDFHLGGGASLNVEWVRLISNADNIGYNFNTDLLTFGVNWHPYFW